MKNTHIMIVGGTFDYSGGKPSGIVNKITAVLNENFGRVVYYNGGFLDELHTQILPKVKDVEVVIWMPNVPNDAPKMRNIKEINPKVILVSSKRNDNSKYTFSELINRALQQKSNLVIEFAKCEDTNMFNMRVFDPLGTLYYQGNNIDQMTYKMANRAVALKRFTRIQSVPIEGDFIVPDQPDFFEFARECSDIFHNLIQPDEGVTRFLGNMSFRCQNGFPSFRGKDGIIYVSRRNVDKRFINAESFVPTYCGEDGKVYYYGEHKPSVDTPIQQRLYKTFPQMNYMIHAHCYTSHPSALCTSHPVPCGAIEEVQEIIKAIRHAELEDSNFIAINLIGHGCLLMATDTSFLHDLKNYKDKYFTPRKMPEDIMQTFIKNIPGDFCWEPAVLTHNTLRNLESLGYQFTVTSYIYSMKSSLHYVFKEVTTENSDYWSKTELNKEIHSFIDDVDKINTTGRVFKSERDGVVYFLFVLRDKLCYKRDIMISCEKTNQRERI